MPAFGFLTGLHTSRSHDQYGIATLRGKTYLWDLYHKNMVRRAICSISLTLEAERQLQSPSETAFDFSKLVQKIERKKHFQLIEQLLVYKHPKKGNSK